MLTQTTNALEIGGAPYVADRWGNLRQVNPQPFHYSADYNAHQGTTLEMAYLRLGVMAGAMGYERLSRARVLELGPGTGCLCNVLKRHCAEVQGYDVAPSEHSTLTLAEAQGGEWDLLIACDVIEHFERIEHLWDFDFEWAYLSYPWTPARIPDDYRHGKPGEHVYHLYPERMASLAFRHGYGGYSYGSPEDLLRPRWDEAQPNICSMILRRQHG